MNKETIELVKKMVEDGNLPQEIAENYCPEIKEIDDDRIRKAITAGVTKLFEEYSVFGHTTKEEVLDWVAKQMHLGWTKYDEQMYGELKIFIQCYQKDKKVKEEMLEWIKTFRPQLNKSTETEWSEEDYNEIETIACHLNNINNEGMAKVLLNIRDKYMSLRPHWKPNDKEMEALEVAIEHCDKAHFVNTNPLLVSLYEDLKKLKG